jgi:tRNA wybutosine-synthesizing protein 2
MKVRAVAKNEIAKLQSEDWVNHQRRPYVHGGTAYIPVRDGYPFDREISKRRRYDGRGFFMLGEVAVVHGSRPSHQDLEKIVAFCHPEGIIWIRSLLDHTRTPDAEVMYGNVGEVQHHENGCMYLLDPRKVMFSQGNHEEKRRMAGLIRESGKKERVADMYAGIGYFTIPVAGNGAFVHAMEINPVAFGYLQRNIVKNSLSDRVEAECGDCRDLLSGTYDRIIMGHFDAITMLPDALGHVKRGSVIHLHSLGPVKGEISSQISGAGFSAEIHVHKVKKYRPHLWHVVQDVMIA